MIIAAFYVNPISRMVKGKRKRDLRYLKKASEDRPEGHDSDSSDSDSDSSETDTKGTKRKRKTAVSSEHYDEDDEDYAPLFGQRGLMVHTKIPFVRRLWEYKTYRLPELEDLDTAGFEDLEWDYPLSRWRKKIAEPVEAALVKVGLRKLSRAYVDHVKRYRLERESDELIRELFLEKLELQKQLNSSNREKETQRGWHHRGMLEKGARTGTGTSGGVMSLSEGEKWGGGGFAPGPAFRRALSRRGLKRRVTDEESRVD